VAVGPNVHGNFEVEFLYVLIHYDKRFLETQLPLSVHPVKQSPNLEVMLPFQIFYLHSGCMIQFELPIRFCLVLELLYLLRYILHQVALNTYLAGLSFDAADLLDLVQ
jgi:hypothetical protein